MRISIVTFLSLATFLAGPSAFPQSAPPDWENPRLTGINNQLAHATAVICPDAKTAL